MGAAVRPNAISRLDQGEINDSINEGTQGRAAPPAGRQPILTGGSMIRPENYITDELIRAFCNEKVGPRFFLPEKPLVDVSVQWVAGGCRLYRLDRAINSSNWARRSTARLLSNGRLGGEAR
jgi:hypothetical protein